MRFDIEAARQAGYTDAEIVDYLGRDNQSFDIGGARNAGYTDAEIAQFMATGEGFSPSPFGALGAIPRGINSALAGVVGAPVDLLNAGLGLVGLGSEQPFGGSASIRQGLDSLASPVQQALGGEGSRITYDSLSQLPPDERWGAVAGEVIGGSVPFAMAPLGLAAAGVQGPGWAAPIMNAAREAPGAFAAAEAAGIIGAAQGGALAELLAPGNDLARMGGEMAGAIVSPISLATRAAGGVGRTVRNFFSGFTQGGRDRRAAEYVVNAFSRTGEDPQAVLDALRRAQDLPATGTVGQTTGSPTVIAIENQLAGQSPRFAAERDTMGIEGLRELREAAERLATSGDPADLVAAARLRETYFNEMMAQRISQANADAERALARVASEGQPGQMAASEEASSILNNAISDARRIEGELWGEIDRTVPIEPNAVLGAYQEGRGRLLPDENLDGAIEGIIARMSEGQPMTSNDLLLLRSRALEFSRRAASGENADRQMAAIYGMIADGALADLSDQMTGSAVDLARNYSRSMHEAFTQTFAGRGVGSTQTGGDMIPPEMLLERAFGAGGTRGDIQFQQLENAAAFNQLGGPPDQGDFGPLMRGAQEDFLRSSALRAGQDPLTGEARPSAIARFLAANESTLGRFPDAQSDIARALSSQRAVESVQSRGQYATEVLGRNSPLGQLLRGETPNAAVRNALNQGESSFISLANLARSGGPEAVDGLASATLDSLMRSSRNQGGDFSFTRFNELLTTPQTSWTQSPLDLMVSQGVIDQGAADRLQEIIRRASLIERPPSANMDEAVIAPPDAITDLITRIIGARIGSAGVAGQGAPLIAAGAGARTATNLFGRMPNARIQEALIEIVKDPRLFELAIARAPSPEMQRDLTRQINAALINAGIDTAYEDDYNSGSSIPQILVQGAGY